MQCLGTRRETRAVSHHVLRALQADLTESQIRNYFGQFGDIEDAVVGAAVAEGVREPVQLIQQ